MKKCLIDMVARPLAVAAVLMAASCGGNETQQQDDSKLAYSPEVNEVEVVTLRRQDFPMQLLSNGKLSASRKSVLYFPESGVITKVNVRNGSPVKEGDVLAELDSQAQSLALESAQLELDKARLEYLDVLAGMGYSTADTVSASEDVLKLARIRSGYENARINFAKARRSMDGIVLRAPFGGRVADLKLKEWDRTGTDPFCAVVGDSSFDVNFYALESEYPFLSSGQTVRVTPFDYVDGEVRGRIIAINPTVDKNGQIAVTAQVGGGARLVDGMNVKVVVERTLSSQLVVPKSAVVIRDGLEVLFRYRNGKAEWVYVNTLRANSESYVIKANEDRGASLSEGDSIIVSGNLNLADGSSVSIRQK